MRGLRLHVTTGYPTSLSLFRHVVRAVTGRWLAGVDDRVDHEEAAVLSDQHVAGMEVFDV